MGQLFFLNFLLILHIINSFTARYLTSGKILLMKTVIKTKNLTKYYGNVVGIKNLNLSVNEGEIIGFIGPNGAGKTTTIRLLLSLIKPTNGSVEIFGKDVETHGTEIRKHIGYLPSEVYYYENMTVAQLLDYSASFYPGNHKPRIKELSKLLKLDLTKKIDDLSFGNKKKVGIVQGLLHKPKLIILDEPTGGLDPLIQRKFYDLLRKENEEGATIFFSSHVLSEVQKLCSRVAIVRDGELINIESIENLRKNSFKKVQLSFDKEPSKSVDLKGATKISTSGNTLSFLYKGDINALTGFIASKKVTDAILDEPELEEIFMHYYK